MDAVFFSLPSLLSLSCLLADTAAAVVSFLLAYLNPLGYSTPPPWAIQSALEEPKGDHYRSRDQSWWRPSSIRFCRGWRSASIMA
eukprot:9756464-Heterocapsa_arctica.AAC.1